MLQFFVDTSLVPGNCSDGDVRLVGGDVDNEGRVEVCVNQVWGSVCFATESHGWYNYWHLADGKVACRKMGHQELGDADSKRL